jgi:catechol 2,3-dioxygenase-like lactoylglutathione lyase family enzyme
MKLQRSYSVLFTSDFAAAETWYSKFLGRTPDYRPMDTMVQWELSRQGGLILTSDNLFTGKGDVFIVVDDVGNERRRLGKLGITLGDDMQGDYSILAQVRDPDGNLITLATAPSRPYPRA